MAYTTINKSTDYFNTKLYTGNGTNATGITGVGFQPDWVWIKERSSTSPHKLLDAVRGATKELESNSTASEQTEATSLQSFNSDGFTVGTNGAVNENSQTYVSWNWKAGTTGSGNTTGSGTYKTYSYSVNTTAGFSIVKYLGNGTAGHTIPHHLGVVPSMYMVKELDNTQSWYVYHKDASYSGSAAKDTELYLDTTDRAYANAKWNDTAPTSSNFCLAGNNSVNQNDTNYIAYCFADKTGYSKFGKYTGNGDGNNGTFVYTGFAPHWLMVKRTDSSGNSWRVYSTNDDLSHGANGRTKLLHANLTNAEDSAGDALDLLSNGFKHVTSSTDQNASGATYIYAAFGQSLVGSNNIPCTAR